jgi:glucose-1-phosphate thymidylyltransferase
VWLGRGVTWLDTGTHETLLEAGCFVRDIHRRQGARIGCVEEIALYMGLIGPDECYELGARMGGSPYGRYVMDQARLYDRIGDLLDWRATFLEGA